MTNLKRTLELDRGFSTRNYLEFFFESESKKDNDAPELTKTTKSDKKNSISSFSVRIPFFENPQISESKQARLGKYKPIGRNSNLYSFLGAESRVITLTFNMTLPHLHEYVRDISLDSYIIRRTSPTGSKSEDKNLFDPSNKNVTSQPKSIGDLLNVIKSYQNQYKNFTGNNVEHTEEQLKIKTLYYFWTNIIRSSVIGTSDHRSPPPIVRLSYGPLFKRVPFVVDRYQINIDEKASYDVITMLPNQIKIVLQMEEIRVGNFGEYSAYSPNIGSILDGENVAGWEAILETGSLDPLAFPVSEV